jgi:hypothetical protein
MWLMTTIGFFSVVQKGTDRDVLTVRARSRQHLQQLKRQCLPGLTIVAGGGSDYPFRTEVRRADWLAAVQALTTEINYPNFKNAATRQLGQGYHETLMQVWTAMLALERPSRSTRRPSSTTNRDMAEPRCGPRSTR